MAVTRWNPWGELFALSDTMDQLFGRTPSSGRGEVAAFRERFGASNRLGTLDWPPMATLSGTIAVYDPLDRRAESPPLAIASTRGTRSLCDPPYSWPPVLRIK